MATDPAPRPSMAPGRGGPGLLRIADAARSVGVSPSALRLWERQGLVAPVRVGRERRYGPEELARIRCVRRLRTVDGLNAAGIRRAIGEVAAADVQPPADGGPGGVEDPVKLGRRLRALRVAASLSLRELGERTGLSPSFLSGLERGTTGASLAALVRLAGAHGTSLAAILAGTTPAGGDRSPPSGASTASAQAGRRVVREQARPALDAGRGIRIEDLAVGSGQLQPQLFVLAPGATSDGAYDHAGEEFLFVLVGRLVVWLDDRECHELAPGDALTFPSSIPHRFVALGRTETRVLWVNTPPTF